jgi:hypothetical protein
MSGKPTEKILVINLFLVSNNISPFNQV